MNRIETLDRLGGAEILESLSRLVRDTRAMTAELLAHLAVADARRLHLAAACSSLHDYCVRRLGLDAETAWRYVGVARLTVRFPELLDLLAAGDIHVAGVRLLAPWLKDDRADDAALAELIRDACGKSCAEIRALLADRFPRRSVPTLVTPLPVDDRDAATGEPPQAVGGLVAREETRGNNEIRTREGETGVCGEAHGSGHGRPTLFGDQGFEGAPGAAGAPGASDSSGRCVSPLGARRYHIQFTGSEELVRTLEEAQALLSHRIPSGDVAAVVGLALSTLCQRVLKERFGVGSRRRSTGSPAAALDSNPVDATDESLPPDATTSRDTEDQPKPGATASRIPREVRAAVYERNGGCCSYVDAEGQRCGSRVRLQIDHIEMACRGGASTADNCRLLCGAHNKAEARRLLGDAFVDKKIRARREGTQRAQAPRPVNRAMLAPSDWRWDDPLLVRILDALRGRSMSLEDLSGVEGMPESRLDVGNALFALLFQERVTFLPSRRKVVRTDELDDAEVTETGETLCAPSEQQGHQGPLPAP